MPKRDKKTIERRRLSIGLVRKALPGTCGITGELAKKLGYSYQRVYDFIHLPGEDFDELRKEIQIERDFLLDLAEDTVKDSIGQRLDLGVASTTARWALDRRGQTRGYKQKQELTLEGGENPLNVQFPIERLLSRVSVACKKELILAMKEMEAESGE